MFTSDIIKHLNTRGNKRRKNMEILWEDRKRPFLGLPISFTKYRLSEDRLFINTGFFTLKEDEIRLYRILDIEFTATLYQRIFGIGTLRIKSSDKSAGNFEIKHIKKPRDIKELLSKRVESERDKKRVINREMMGIDNDFDNEEA